MNSMTIPMHEFEIELNHNHKETLPYAVCVDRNTVSYNGSFGGIVILKNKVLNWLNENVGDRLSETWNWYINYPANLIEFRFLNEDDAIHFSLVWGGDSGNNL